MRKTLCIVFALLTMLIMMFTTGSCADPMSTVLDTWYQVLSNNYPAESYEQYGIPVIVHSISPLPLYSVGYAFSDVDQDGTPELILGCTASGDYSRLTLALYDNGIQIFRSGERDRYYYLGGNLFCHNGSSGWNDSFDTTEMYSGNTMIDLGYVSDPSAFPQTTMMPLAAWSSGGVQPTASPYSQTRRINGQTRDRVHLRRSASASSASLGLYFTGTEVTLLSDTGEWSHVRIGTQEGYMMSRYLTTGNVSSRQPTGYALGNQYVNLRSSPSTSAQVLKRISSGTWVSIMGETWDHWYYLRSYDGSTGYAMASLIQMQ